MGNKAHVEAGDTTIILSGKERGKQGKVLAVGPKEGKVIIEGRSIVTKHVKPRKMGAPGGLVRVKGALYACKVQTVCPHYGKLTRVVHRLCGDGTKNHACVKCGESL